MTLLTNMVKNQSYASVSTIIKYEINRTSMCLSMCLPVYPSVEQNLVNPWTDMVLLCSEASYSSSEELYPFCGRVIQPSKEKKYISQ